MASLIVLPTTDNWPRKSTNARLLVTVSLKASSNFLKAEAQLLGSKAIVAMASGRTIEP